MSDQNEAQRSEPRARSVRLPQGYGTSERLLPWSYARQRLEQAQNYWLCTASPSAVPHAAPLWGVWLGEQLIFDGHPATRWGSNILANPHVSVHLESGVEVVIVEGTVEDVAEPGSAWYGRAAAAFKAKYNYDLPDHGFFVLHPRMVLAWTEFPKDATRWVLADE